MTSHDHVTPEFLPDVVSHSKSDTVIKIITIIMTSMVKMTIMTMMIMMDRGLCRAGLNFPARDRLKWVRGGLMPHPDAIPRSSSSSE